LQKKQEGILLKNEQSPLLRDMEPEKPKHPWWARLSVGIAMLVLAFLGVLLTDLESTGDWEYWKWTVPAYAILALWLSWYVRRTKQTVSPITLWHELLHWVGLFGAVLLVSMFVDMGILSRSLAGLFVLTLLALTVFTVGVYIESTFLLIGVVLGLFAALVAITVKYLYAFSIPILIIGIGTLVYMIRRSHKKMAPNDSSSQDHSERLKK
jgi:hypothetical protein